MNEDICLCGRPYGEHRDGGYCRASGCEEFRIDVDNSPAITHGDLDFLAHIVDRDFARIDDQNRADAIVEKLKHQLFPHH